MRQPFASEPLTSGSDQRFLEIVRLRPIRRADNREAELRFYTTDNRIRDINLILSDYPATINRVRLVICEAIQNRLLNSNATQPAVGNLGLRH